MRKAQSSVTESGFLGVTIWILSKSVTSSIQLYPWITLFRKVQINMVMMIIIQHRIMSDWSVVCFNFFLMTILAPIPGFELGSVA